MRTMKEVIESVGVINSLGIIERPDPNPELEEEDEDEMDDSISTGALERLAESMISNSRTKAMLERYGIEASEDHVRIKDALVLFLKGFFNR